MNKNFKTSSITEAAMIAGILVVMALLSYYILPFLEFLFPVPAIVLSKRKGFKYSIMAMVSASLIVTMLLGIPVGVMYLVLYTPVGGVMSYMIGKDQKASKVIVVGGFVVVVSIVVLLSMLKLFMNVSLVDSINESIEEVLTMQGKLVDSMNLDKSTFDMTANMFREATDYFIMVMPAFFIAISFLFVVANYFVAQMVLYKLQIPMVHIKDLCFFYLSRTTAIIMFSTVLFAFILKYAGYNQMDIMYENLFTLVRLALLVQGLAIVKYYLVQRKVSGVIRFLSFLAIIFIPIVSFGVMLVSLADCMVDFRKLRIKIDN